MPYNELRLDSQLCVRLYTASRLVIQAYHPFLEKINLTYPQYIVMLILWEKDNITVGEISKRLLLETNTLTPLLKRIEKEGLISKKTSPKDTRQKIISLTKKGKDLEEQALEVPRCMQDFLLSNNINEEDLSSIIPVMDNLIDTLKNINPSFKTTK